VVDDENGIRINPLQEDRVSTTSTEVTPVANPAHKERARSGLNFYVARTLEDVLEAWQLVYIAYRRAELIDSNPYELHTMQQAVGPQTMVVTGCLGPLSVSTLSVYIDHPGGLPLDSVYKDELANLRQEGRRIMEVGLFGDRRDHLNRSAEGLFELMRFAYFYGVYNNVDDVVIGIHPDHAAFYKRFFAFEQFGDRRDYPTVKNNPVIPLRLNLRSVAALDPLPKGLRYFADNQLSERVYSNRFTFDPAQVAASPIAQFLSNSRKAVRAA
jgi:hypothetical protein